MGELKKVLSFRVLLLITINSIMGTGVFFLPAMGASIAGPASLISWVLLSFIAIYTGMCFAELASMYPTEGGVYEFCKHAYGRFWAFIIGWVTIISAYITIAMLVVGAIQYLLPVNAPIIKIVLSLFFIVAFNFIAYRGMKVSAMLLIAFSIITFSTLLALIIPGLFTIKLSNFTPFFVAPGSAIFVAIFFIAETFFGWETATFLAGETKDGAKVLPKALIAGTVIIAAICILFVFTSIGTMNWTQFGLSSTPLADLGELHFGMLGRSIFTILVYLSIIGSVAGWIVAAPRLILAMAKDKLFLSQFSAIHDVHKTPAKAILLQTITISIIVIVGAGSYELLLQLLVPLVLIMYSAVMLSLVVLRIHKPNAKRYFTVPFGKIGPIILVIFNAILLIMWLNHSESAFGILKLGFSFILLGIPLYFLIELYNDPDMIVSVNDAFANLHLMFESFNLPMHIRKEIMQSIGVIKGKKILEYGCNVGTLTQHLAEEAGEEGKVYATNISQNELKITEKRLAQKFNVVSNVELIYDIEHASRIHPSLSYVDCAVSVGMLSYVIDPNKVLKELASLLPKHGKVCFVEYVDYFHLLPNVEWLSDIKKIKRIFKDAGLLVHIRKKHWLFWNYMFIYGIKTNEEVPFV